MTIVFLYDTGLEANRAGWIMFWCINACYVISMMVAIFKLIKALIAKIRQFREQKAKQKAEQKAEQKAKEGTKLQVKETDPI